VTEPFTAMGRRCAAHNHREDVPLEVHHVWPTGKGGPDVAWNRVTVCANAHGATPEGKAARDYAATLLTPGLSVTFVSHKLDKYGRPLGEITWPAGGGGWWSFANLMVANGHAREVDW
jgi:hypothetical protein